MTDEEKILRILEGRIYKNDSREWLFAQEMLHFPGYPLHVWENGHWRMLSLTEIGRLEMQNKRLIDKLDKVMHD